MSEIQHAHPHIPAVAGASNAPRVTVSLTALKLARPYLHNVVADQTISMFAIDNIPNRSLAIEIQYYYSNRSDKLSLDFTALFVKHSPE